MQSCQTPRRGRGWQGYSPIHFIAGIYFSSTPDGANASNKWRNTNLNVCLYWTIFSPTTLKWSPQSLHARCVLWKTRLIVHYCTGPLPDGPSWRTPTYSSCARPLENSPFQDRGKNECKSIFIYVYNVEGKAVFNWVSYNQNHSYHSSQSQKTQTILSTNQNSKKSPAAKVKPKSTGKRVRTSHDWFWFSLWLDEKVARIFFNPIM